MAEAQELLKLDSKFMVRPFGLHNTGVICHFNSLLQMLMSCTSLTQTVTNQLVRSKGNNLLKMYANLIHNQPEWSVHLIQELVKEMRNRKRSEMFGNLQESASEGLILLLEMMNSQAIYHLFYHRYELRIICEKCGDVVSKTTDFEIHFEFFLDNAAKYPKTADEFANYIRRHTSEVDEYTCEKCKNKAKNITRRHSLKMLPEILIILFNKYGNKKDMVWYPNEMTFPGKDGQRLRYKLVAEIKHSGTVNGGHYTSAGLRNAGYFAFNDMSVMTSSPEPSANSYIIAYHFVEYA